MSRANAEGFLGLALPRDEVANNANGDLGLHVQNGGRVRRSQRPRATFVFADGPAVVALGRFTPASLGDGPIELPGIGTRSMRSADGSRVEILAPVRFGQVGWCPTRPRPSPMHWPPRCESL